MDSYSSTTNSNTDSSSSNSSSWFSYHYDHQQQLPPPPRSTATAGFRSALHSVRKTPAKNVITKKPIAPLPPARQKIYKVEPVEFKDLVQKLTGAEFQPTTRLQEVAPPPLSLCPPHRQPCLDSEMNALVSERKKAVDSSTFGALSPLGFSLSPSSVAWCSAMLLSPGTLALFEPSVVL